MLQADLQRWDDANQAVFKFVLEDERLRVALADHLLPTKNRLYFLEYDAFGIDQFDHGGGVTIETSRALLQLVKYGELQQGAVRVSGLMSDAAFIVARNLQFSEPEFRKLEMAVCGQRNRLFETLSASIDYMANKDWGVPLDRGAVYSAACMGALDGINRFDCKLDTSPASYVAIWMRKSVMQLINSENHIVGTESQVSGSSSSAREAIGTAVELHPGLVDTSASNELDQLSSIRLLHKLLARMPAKYQSAVSMRFGLAGREPMSTAEIAKLHKCSPQTVNADLRGAMSWLRKELGDLSVFASYDMLDESPADGVFSECA